MCRQIPGTTDGQTTAYSDVVVRHHSDRANHHQNDERPRRYRHVVAVFAFRGLAIHVAFSEYNHIDRGDFADFLRCFYHRTVRVRKNYPILFDFGARNQENRVKCTISSHFELPRSDQRNLHHSCVQKGTVLRGQVHKTATQVRGGSDKLQLHLAMDFSDDGPIRTDHHRLHMLLRCALQKLQLCGQQCTDGTRHQLFVPNHDHFVLHFENDRRYRVANECHCKNATIH